VIAFATCIGTRATFERCAAPGLRRAMEPDSVFAELTTDRSIHEAYNEALEHFAGVDDLEALVLLHQDAEITGGDFCAELRARNLAPFLAERTGLAIDRVRSIAWWEGSVTWASFTHRYEELGGGELPGFAWNGAGMPAYARTGEVDTVDGFVLALAPWTVRNVRFDESLGQLHGYDFDFCLQVREQGRRVVTADFKVVHHHSLELASDLETWRAAHVRVAEKWDGRMPGVGTGGGTWRQRARRGEAEAAAAEAQALAGSRRARSAHSGVAA